MNALFKYLLILIGIIVSVLFVIWIFSFDFTLPEGYKFCNNQGYERTSFGGSYSERQGKVECVACYKGECEYEEFDVKKVFGVIVEDKK